MGNLLDSLFPEGGWLAKAQRAYTGLGGTPDEVLGPRPAAREELSVPRGELLSPLAARLASLKSGRDPVGNALLNFAGPIKAYHGSPHLFDKFSMKNVGTGEGAQAYGHGLYFAGNEGVAKSYRDALTANRLDLGPWRSQIGVLNNKIAELNGKIMSGGRGSVEVQRAVSELDTLMAQREALLKSPPPPPRGSMYEVSLRTEPERLLDWDKPLSAQSDHVKKALSSPEIKAIRTFKPDELGRYMAPNRAGAADIYRELGIDGVQYLDAGSRAAGTGSRNYAIINDSIIDILKRYGLGGAAIGAGNALISEEQ